MLMQPSSSVTASRRWWLICVQYAIANGGARLSAGFTTTLCAMGLLPSLTNWFERARVGMGAPAGDTPIVLKVSRALTAELA